MFPLTEDLKYCKQIRERMENYKKENIYQQMIVEKIMWKKESREKIS